MGLRSDPQVIQHFGYGRREALAGVRTRPWHRDHMPWLRSRPVNARWITALIAGW
jgi:hypothetical protein